MRVFNRISRLGSRDLIEAIAGERSAASRAQNIDLQLVRSENGIRGSAHHSFARSGFFGQIRPGSSVITASILDLLQIRPERDYLKIAQRFIAGKHRKRMISPEGTADVCYFFRPTGLERLTCPNPSNESLGYYHKVRFAD